MHIKHWPSRLTVVLAGFTLAVGIVAAVSGIIKVASDDFEARYFTTEIANAPCITAEDDLPWLNHGDRSKTSAPLVDSDYVIIPQDWLDKPTCSVAHIFQKDQFFDDVVNDVLSVFFVLLMLVGAVALILLLLEFVQSAPANDTDTAPAPPPVADEKKPVKIEKEDGPKVTEPNHSSYEPPVAKAEPVSIA